MQNKNHIWNTLMLKILLCDDELNKGVKHLMPHWKIQKIEIVASFVDKCNPWKTCQPMNFQLRRSLSVVRNNSSPYISRFCNAKLQLLKIMIRNELLLGVCTANLKTGTLNWKCVRFENKESISVYLRFLKSLEIL